MPAYGDHPRNGRDRQELPVAAANPMQLNVIGADG
jgi:hypothetical protein